MTATYDQAIVALALLIEEETLDEGFDNEHLRGAIELIADVWPASGVFMSDRKDMILDDLRSNYHYITVNGVKP